MVCYSLGSLVIGVPSPLCTVELLAALTDKGFTSSQEKPSMGVVVHPQYWVRLHHRKANSGLSLKNWIKKEGLPPFPLLAKVLRVEFGELEEQLGIEPISWPRAHGTICLSTAGQIRNFYPELTNLYRKLDSTDML